MINQELLTKNKITLSNLLLNNTVTEIGEETQDSDLGD